jgi:hypothetical protein
MIIVAHGREDYGLLPVSEKMKISMGGAVAHDGALMPGLERCMLRKLVALS